MKTRLAVAAIVAACVPTLAAAQMGAGMMHGAGPAKSPGQGMGPSMMGAQGECAMGGQGMGRGMMGGHMMGGHMGSGHMGGGHMGGGHMGGGHMGGGHMMGGPGIASLDRLNLDKEQRAKVTAAQRDLQRKMHALMGTMHELRWQDEDRNRAGEFDEAGERKRFEAHAALQKQMFEARLDAHKRMLGVLTKEQREQLGK